MLPGPGRQPNEPHFGSKLSSESLDSLIGFLAYLEWKVSFKKKIGKTFAPTKANFMYVILMAITRQRIELESC